MKKKDVISIIIITLAASAVDIDLSEFGVHPAAYVGIGNIDRKTGTVTRVKNK